MDPSGLPGALMSVFVLFGSISLFSDRSTGWPFLGMVIGFALVLSIYAVAGVREHRREKAEAKAADAAVDAWFADVPGPCDTLGPPPRPPEP